jgi:hypothetical protein
VRGTCPGFSLDSVSTHPPAGVGNVVQNSQRLVVAVDRTGITAKHPDDSEGDQRAGYKQKKDDGAHHAKPLLTSAGRR